MIGRTALAFSAATTVLPLVSAFPATQGWVTPRNITRRQTTWTSVQSWSGSSFFDNFSYQVSGDTGTHGQVNYIQDASTTYVDSNNNAIIKVDDSTDLASGANRNSARITSNYALNEGSLVIADITHVPYGCSVWPAYWLLGPSWPAGGEVDIFEGVNLNTNNAMTLHTESGCTHDTAATETGTAGQADCNTAVNSNTGCGVTDNSGVSFGDAFNNNNGGVWATEWTSDGISIWFFPRTSIPADITSGAPNPAGWGTPSADWPFTTCASSFFNNLNVVFDITLCGDWAGAVYDDTCSGACSDEVTSGANYHDAYFSVSSINVYTS